MEALETLTSQRNLEKEKQGWRNQIHWLQTSLQTYSNQESIVWAQKQKYSSMEKDRNPSDKSMLLWSPLKKETRIYNGENGNVVLGTLDSYM